MPHSRRTGRYALASAFVIAVIAAPFAVAQTNSNGSGRFVSNDPRYTLYSKNTRTDDGGGSILREDDSSGGSGDGGGISRKDDGGDGIP